MQNKKNYEGERYSENFGYKQLIFSLIRHLETDFIHLLDHQVR